MHFYLLYCCKWLSKGWKYSSMDRVIAYHVWSLDSIPNAALIKRGKAHLWSQHPVERGLSEVEGHLQLHNKLREMKCTQALTLPNLINKRLSLSITLSFMLIWSCLSLRETLFYLRPLPTTFLVCHFLLSIYSILLVFWGGCLFVLCSMVNLNTWVDWNKLSHRFHHLREFLQTSLCSHHLLHPQGSGCHSSVFHRYTILFSITKCINRITQYESFQVWLLLLSKMPLRVIQIVMHMNKSFS